MALVDSALQAPRTPPASSLRRGGPRAPNAHAATWGRLALYALALIAAFAGLSPIFRDNGWFLPLAALLLVPLVTIGLARTFSRRSWVPAVAGAASAVLLLSLVFAPLESLLGLVPTSETLARWAELAAGGFDSMARQSVPAVARDGIQFLLTVLAFASVVFVAPALDRAPAIAAVPLLIVLDIPVAVRAGLADPFWFVLASAAFLALLRVGRRRMPAAGVLVTAAAVVTASLLLPGALPPPRPAGSTPGGFGSGVNPLIDLGEDLRRDDPVVALRYTSTASAGIYLRLATLDRFDGVSWIPDSTMEPDGDVEQLPPPPGIRDDVARTAHTVEIALSDIGGRWVPLPYPATAVRGGGDDWRFEDEGLTVRAESSVSGAEYSVDFVDVEPLLEQVNTTAEADVSTRYLAVPFLPEIIRETARQVAGEGTPYERALALQSFFTETDFVYSLDAPVDNGYDGTGVGVIAEFLRERSGYCVHFASAMAVMARAQGIPARVVVGFQPGSSALVEGRRVYTALSSDLHAWPELYFEGVGWLRFEPTPGRGSIPDYSGVAAVDDPLTPVDESVRPTAAPTTAPTRPPIDDGPEQDPAGPGTVARQQNPWTVVGLVALGLVALLLSPAATRVVIRRSRLARVRSGRDAGAAWAEVRDTAIDHDWAAPDSETPRQLSERLAIVVGGSAVQPLRDGVESTAYDRPGRGSLTAADVDALVRAISRSAAARVRLRATFLPPSLLARVGLARRETQG